MEEEMSRKKRHWFKPNGECEGGAEQLKALEWFPQENVETIATKVPKAPQDLEQIAVIEIQDSQKFTSVIPCH